MTLGDLLSLPRESFLNAAYKRILGREPDAAGLSHYQSKLRLGSGKIAVLYDLFTSREADLLGPHGDLHALGGEEFINAVYRRVLGRSPEPGGLRHYLQVLRHPGGRRRMLRDIQVSDEAFSRDPHAGSFYRELEAVLADEGKARHWSGWRERAASIRRTLFLLGDRLDELNARMHALEERMDSLAAQPARVAGVISPESAAPTKCAEASPNIVALHVIEPRSVFDLAAQIDTTDPMKFFRELAKAVAGSREARDLYPAR